MSEDAFKSELLKRIDSYRSTEEAIEDRIDSLRAEQLTAAERRKSAEQLYEAEFGPIDSESNEREPSNTHTTEIQSVESPVAKGPLTGLSWEDAIEHVLAGAGKPLHVNEIHKRLLEGGFRTNAKNPSNSIVAIAVRSDALVKAGTNTYWLANNANPEESHQAALGDSLD